MNQTTLSIYRSFHWNDKNFKTFITTPDVEDIDLYKRFKDYINTDHALKCK